MNPLTRKLLLATLAVAQFLIGAGSGERVVYFCATHKSHEHCPHGDSPADHADHGHSHGHDQGGIARILAFLPLVVPVDALHRHGPHTECEHVHLQGVDSVGVSGPVVVGRPIPAPLPVFLSHAGFVAASSGESLSVETDGPPPRPPSAPPDSQVRLLI